MKVRLDETYKLSFHPNLAKSTISNFSVLIAPDFGEFFHSFLLKLDFIREAVNNFNETQFSDVFQLEDAKMRCCSVISRKLLVTKQYIESVLVRVTLVTFRFKVVYFVVLKITCPVHCMLELLIDR